VCHLLVVFYTCLFYYIPDKQLIINRCSCIGGHFTSKSAAKVRLFDLNAKKNTSSNHSFFCSIFLYLYLQLLAALPIKKAGRVCY